MFNKLKDNKSDYQSYKKFFHCLLTSPLHDRTCQRAKDGDRFQREELLGIVWVGISRNIGKLSIGSGTQLEVA